MANAIKPKSTSTVSKVAASGDLLVGELGSNIADGVLFLKKSDNSIAVFKTTNETITLSGDVSGSGTSGITTTLATVGVAKGGTGLTTLTANNVIIGNGTSTPSFVAPGSSGNLLTSNGTTWQSTAPAAATGLPTGALCPYAGASAPTGFLLCDGSSVSSSSYLALHAVISNTYGGSAYTGATGLSFNLPDLKGRMPIGSMGTGSGLTTRVTGTKYGTETHTLAASNIPSLTTGNMSANSTHTHNITTGGGSQLGLMALGFSATGGAYAGSLFGNQPQANSSLYGLAASASIQHSHTYTNASPTAVDHIPPTLALNYIIKT